VRALAVALAQFGLTPPTSVYLSLPAVLTRPESWWGGGLYNVMISKNCYLSLVELANTTSCVKGITKGGIVVQARLASQSIWEAFYLFTKDDAHCGSKPARWRRGVFFTNHMIRHEIPEEPDRRDSKQVSPSASTSPLKNMDASPPGRKAHAREINDKAGSISNTCELLSTRVQG
jgi:hypothetical protein